ncbi:MAG TPA: recombinase family protein [Acidimicrobiales bacterium]|nr:recombinase family protein [Acidimicrobiales bacterium]
MVAQMRELKAEGYSLHAIAQRLNDEGLRPKRGEHWQATQVARVLQRSE